MYRKLIAVLAGVILLVAFVSIRARFWPTAARMNPARVRSLGQVVAEEAVQVLAGHGSVVAVINEQHQIPGNPLHDEFEDFQAGLKQSSAIRLTGTEVVPVDENEFVSGIGCSTSQLQAILQKYADANAIVFFVSLPEWGKLTARGIVLQPSATKLVVALNGSTPTKTDYDGYFANGLLSVLIGARPSPTPAAAPKTPREWFDKYYQVFTPQNYESLPD